MVKRFYDIIKAAGFDNRVDESKQWFEERTYREICSMNSLAISIEDWTEYILKILKDSGRYIQFNDQLKAHIKKALNTHYKQFINLGTESRHLQCNIYNKDALEYIGNVTGWWKMIYKNIYTDEIIRTDTGWDSNIKRKVCIRINHILTPKDRKPFLRISKIVKSVFGKPPTILIIGYLCRDSLKTHNI